MNATRSKFQASFSRRRGAAVVYLAAVMTVMVGFASLGVDVARCQLAKAALRHTARAAALAAAENLSNGQTAAINAALFMGTSNKCDGTPVSLNSSTDITFVIWSPTTRTYTVAPSFSQANAVLVHARRTKATRNPISLSFAGVIGMPTCDVQSSAVAYRNMQSVTQYVPATSNPWLAGMPTGTLASVPDRGYKGPQVVAEHPWAHDIAGPAGGHASSGEGYESPIQVGITLTPGATVTITNVTGNAVNDFTQSDTYTANGSNGGAFAIYHDEAATGSGAPMEHGITSLNTPINSMVGVFLTNQQPDQNSSTADMLDFSTQTERDYTNISPEIQQSFYAGNGQTSNGVQQTLTVPANATRLFLGTMDGHEWSNNFGGYTATITQTTYSIVQ